MNFLAKRTLKIQESATLKIMAQANIMRKNGEDIVILAAGEPDFDTPDYIKQGAIDAINKGYTKYTASIGIIELRNAISNKFKLENNLDYNANQIIVSNGGKQAIYNTLQAIINDGDEVIIPAPYWVSYPDMVLLADGVPVIVNCPLDVNFKLTPSMLEKAITDKTKAIILNSPNNPTGMMYSKDELIQISEVLRRYPNIFIISDDLYEHIIFNDNKFVNIANVAPDLLERIIIVNGVSKVYAMTGWRIGYAASQNETLIKTINIIQSQSTSNPCSISQYAALTALNAGTSHIMGMIKEFEIRHQYVLDRLKNIPDIKYLSANGAFYAFFDCSIIIQKLYNAKKINTPHDVAFSEYLLNNYKVAGVPGSAFGMDNHLRISFATNLEEIKKGLDRIENAISSTFAT